MTTTEQALYRDFYLNLGVMAPIESESDPVARFLTSLGIDYHEVLLDSSPDMLRVMILDENGERQLRDGEVIHAERRLNATEERSFVQAVADSAERKRSKSNG